MTNPGPRPDGRLHTYGDGELHTAGDVLSEDEYEVTFPHEPDPERARIEAWIQRWNDEIDEHRQLIDEAVARLMDES